MAPTSRRLNFTEEELLALAASIKEREDILFGKFEGQKVSRSSKIKSWIEVRDAVNAVGVNDRSVDECKTKYKNLKTTTKQIEVENRKEIHQTGGGKAKLRTLTESQRIVLETIPTECIIGIPVGIDLHEGALFVDLNIRSVGV